MVDRHEIRISERYFELCRQRRGRLHAFETIDPTSTALVVVDMQNAFVEPGQSVLEIPKSRGIIDNIGQLAETLRAAGGVVAWTRHSFLDDWPSFYGHFTTGDVARRMIEETRPGSFGHQLSSRFAVGVSDIVVDKRRPSVFIQGSSNLEKKLRAQGIDTLIITGVLTNACCESSARDAAALGFKTLFVADATATRSDEEHNAALINLMQFVADLWWTDELALMIQDVSE